jgi:hypothetical protein
MSPTGTHCPPDLSSGGIGLQPFSRKRQDCFDSDPTGALHRAFPDFQHAPSGTVKFGFHLGVPLLIPADFLPPEILAGAWPAEQWTIVPVPETAMHEDSSSPARQYHVGLAGQTPVMKQISEAEGVKAMPHDQLGLSVLAPDPRHHPAAGSRVDYITRQEP